MYRQNYLVPVIIGRNHSPNKRELNTPRYQKKKRKKITLFSRISISAFRQSLSLSRLGDQCSFFFFFFVEIVRCSQQRGRIGKLTGFRKQKRETRAMVQSEKSVFWQKKKRKANSVPDIDFFVNFKKQHF